jgi:dTDP-4-dehydrorhamnose 3,5-epimerase
MDEPKINGVIITPLKRIKNPKGDIYHAMKASADGYAGFGEAYFSTVYKDDIKGWKKHTRMSINLVVPIGAMRFVIYDDREGSTTKGQYFDVTLSADNYARLTVTPGLWMAFQGVGEGVNMLLNMASIEHNSDEAINCDLSEFKFDK